MKPQFLLIEKPSVGFCDLFFTTGNGCLHRSLSITRALGRAKIHRGKLPQFERHDTGTETIFVNVLCPTGDAKDILPVLQGTDFQEITIEGARLAMPKLPENLEEFVELLRRLEDIDEE
jgi:hypothetical protein